MEERGHWDKKVEYILAVAGAIVGLGNVWRFPYLCYKNGGGKKEIFKSCFLESVLLCCWLHVYLHLGAFLVPYLILAVTCGIPLFLLETTVGQYTQEGSVTCWRKLCPLVEGRTCCITHLQWCEVVIHYPFNQLWPRWLQHDLCEPFSLVGKYLYRTNITE